MKICLVTHQFVSPFSGVGTYARVLAHGLATAGADIAVLCPEDQRDASSDLLFLSSPALSRSGSHARWIYASRAFARCLGKSPSFDVVHFLDAREALAYGGRGPAVVGTVHDYYFTHPFSYWRARQYYPDWKKRLAYAVAVRTFEPMAYRKQSRLIANSDATRARILSAYGLPAERMKTIYIALGLHVEKNTPSQERRENTVLFVGGNPYRKGLPRLLRSISSLRREHPDIELWAVGTPLPKPLKRLITQLGLGQCLTHWPSLSKKDLIALYRKATCLALPGLTEAFGLVFLEALSFGCPVIGPTDGGAGEIIDDDETGFLIPAADDALLTHRLTQLLNDSNLRDRMVQAAKPRLARFNTNTMVAQTLEVYESVLER